MPPAAATLPEAAKTKQPRLRRVEMHPYPRLRRYFHLKVKRLTTFCASLALLQNVFAVHPKGKHVTGFSGRFTPLQHGYHRLTGFSGRYRSPTNPVRWCDSSSLATGGSVSLDSQVALLPYESSSLATSRGRKEGGAPRSRSRSRPRRQAPPDPSRFAAAQLPDFKFPRCSV